MAVLHATHLMNTYDQDICKTIQSRVINIVPKLVINISEQHPWYIPNTTTPGTNSINELDSHYDTHCAGNHWYLMDYTVNICEVINFLNYYDPVYDIPVV